MGGRKAIAVWWAFCLPAMETAAIKRHAAIDRQVWAGDYFDTVATLLDLLQQKLASPRDRRPRAGDLVRTTIELLQQARDDLLHLQERYQIVPRKTRP